MIPKKLVSFPKFLIISFLMLFVFFLVQDQVYAQKIDPKVFKSLRYRHIGPVGNRVTSVVGVPGDPHVYFAGAASGGIWKTEDGGIRWRPIFDKQDVQSIGAGIYKSTDGGKNWKLIGLEKTARIGKIMSDRGYC